MNLRRQRGHGNLIIVYLEILNKQSEGAIVIPIYNIEFIENNENNDIQLTISDELFLEVILTEIRGKTVYCFAYKKNRDHYEKKQLQEEIRILEEQLEIDVDRIEEKK